MCLCAVPALFNAALEAVRKEARTELTGSGWMSSKRGRFKPLASLVGNFCILWHAVLVKASLCFKTDEEKDQLMRRKIIHSGLQAVRSG